MVWLFSFEWKLVLVCYLCLLHARCSAAWRSPRRKERSMPVFDICHKSDRCPCQKVVFDFCHKSDRCPCQKVSASCFQILWLLMDVDGQFTCSFLASTEHKLLELYDANKYSYNKKQKHQWKRKEILKKKIHDKNSERNVGHHKSLAPSKNR